MILHFVSACAFEECLFCSHQHEVSYPETASERIHQAVTPGREAEGKGGRRMLGLQTDSWSSQTSTLELLQFRVVRWLHSCDAASKVTAPGRQLVAGARTLSSSWRRDALLWPPPELAVLNTWPAPPVPRERWRHHLEHTGSAFWGGSAFAGTASSLLPSRGRQEGPCLAFPHLPQPMKWNLDYRSKL